MARGVGCVAVVYPGFDFVGVLYSGGLRGTEYPPKREGGPRVLPRNKKNGFYL